jgi:hypothetical protein
MMVKSAARFEWLQSGQLYKVPTAISLADYP